MQKWNEMKSKRAMCGAEGYTMWYMHYLTFGSCAVVVPMLQSMFSMSEDIFPLIMSFCCIFVSLSCLGNRLTVCAGQPFLFVLYEIHFAVPCSVHGHHISGAIITIHDSNWTKKSNSFPRQVWVSSTDIEARAHTHTLNPLLSGRSALFQFFCFMALLSFLTIPIPSVQSTRHIIFCFARFARAFSHFASGRRRTDFFLHVQTK